MSYINAETIRALREDRKMTQRELAERLSVSDKAVSKWETGRGLPDITQLPGLASALGVSVAELMTGEVRVNRNRRADLREACFYICPVCGNVICSIGEGAFHCCGVLLPRLEPEETDAALQVEESEDEYYVTAGHPMEKEHYLSFLAYVTGDRVELRKLYPEWGAQARFFRRGSGRIYACCNRHGLCVIEV